jgi:hypothetical protein
LPTIVQLVGYADESLGNPFYPDDEVVFAACEWGEPLFRFEAVLGELRLLWTERAVVERLLERCMYLVGIAFYSSAMERPQLLDFRRRPFDELLDERRTSMNAPASAALCGMDFRSAIRASWTCSLCSSVESCSNSTLDSRSTVVGFMRCPLGRADG